VPAARAQLPIFDRIFTRVGAADDLSTGQSTFMVEMTEAAQILRFATAKSLVILDEVGRGTSTQDGQAIAAAILEDLTLRAKSYAFFATHYHDLVELKRKIPSLVLMQTEVREGDRGIIFTHKLVPGAANSSFGIEVAKLAGIPPRVIDRANHFLTQSASNVAKDKAKIKRTPPPLFGDEETGLESFPFFGKMGNSTNPNPAAQELWVTELTDRLKRVEPTNLTPMDALKVLDDLKKLMPVPFADRSPSKPLS
jgi:DNA mismatch repair protein MutS